MSHGEIFWLCLMFWACLDPCEPSWTTFLGRSALVITIIYNFVLWIVDTAHPTIG